MSSTPDMPTFPKKCMYAIGSLVALCAILFVANRFMRSDSEIAEDHADKPGVTTMRGPLTMPFIIAVVLCMVAIISCVWYFDISRKAWIYKHGSQEQKIAQAVSDAISAASRT